MTRTANMAAVLVAKSVGGNVFFGFISAVAFATILAVVAAAHAVGRLGSGAQPSKSQHRIFSDSRLFTTLLKE